MKRQLLRLGWLATLCASLFASSAYTQINSSATWKGGSGAWSNQNQWTCGITGQGTKPCVPNGGQFVIVLLNGGTINVDIGVTVGNILDAFGTTTLVLNGTSLSSPTIGNVASVQVTNGTINTSNLTTLNLSMQNSTLTGPAGVAGPIGTLTGTANITNSSLQQLGVGGTFKIVNSSLGDNSVLVNSGQSTISGTSYNGELTLNATGSVVIDNGSKINSVLQGTAVPVNVGLNPGSSAALTIQGGSQLSIQGNDLILGAFGTTGSVTLSDTSTLSANGETIGDSGTGKFNQGGGTNIASGTLTLATSAGSTGTYNLSGGQLTAKAEVVGSAGTGTFNQFSGTNTVNTTLTLGSVAGASTFGKYNLSGGQLTAEDEIVGANGAGGFNQNGGTNTVTGTLILASEISGTGTGFYNLSNAGTSLSASNEVIGQFGTGRFTQSGGTNQVTGTLTLGRFIGVEGDYNLQGTGQLTAGNEVIGNLGEGSFVQAFGNQTFNAALGTITLGAQKGSNGSYTLIGAGNDVFAANEVIGDSGTGFFAENSGADNKITGTLTLAQSASGFGRYDLKGGSLEADTEAIGGEGISAEFNHSGGTNAIAGNLGIAATGSALGTYNLSGISTLTAGSETLGNDPCAILSCPVPGTFNQTGGGNATPNLTINYGSYNLSGGSLQAGSITDNGTIAVSGTGSLSATSLTIGKAGSATLNGSSLTVNVTVSTIANGTITEMGIGTASISWGDFTGNAPIIVDPATNHFNNLTMLSNGYIQAAAGSVFDVAGNFLDHSTQNTLWNTSGAELDFSGTGTHTFDLAGQNGAGFTDNFAWGTLAIDPGNILDLGIGSGDALYVDFLRGLDISGNTITNIDGAPGLFLYYDAADNPLLTGDYNLTRGGELLAESGSGSPTPEPSSILFLGAGLVAFALAASWKRKKICC